MSEKTERTFVIMEVTGPIGNPIRKLDGIQKYLTNDDDEHLYIKPSRLIPESRLRYGELKGGDKYFNTGNGIGWQISSMDYKTLPHVLILDPEPEEKDEWGEWVEDAPEKFIVNWSHTELKDWLKRMPKRDSE